LFNGHWHAPFEQYFPPEHVLPHAPQFFASVARLTQPTQQVLPALQEQGTQLLLTHISPSWQAAAHAPQWWASLILSVQSPPQSVSPVGQVQAPAVHP
jgi:hypothetical protein